MKSKMDRLTREFRVAANVGRPQVAYRETIKGPVAKVEVSSWLAIGGLTRRLNVNFVHRESIPGRARTLLRALRTLQRGVSVLNFPEGTTFADFVLTRPE